MAERTDQRTRELDGDEDAVTEPVADVDPDDVLDDSTGTEPDEREAADESDSLLGGRISVLSLLLVLAPPFVTAFFIGSVPLVPDAFATAIGAALGLLAGGFATGLVRGTGQYGEAGLAGAIVGLLAAWSLGGGFAVPTAAGGLLAGIVIALLGTYSGCDLRAGLTKDLS